MSDGFDPYAVLGVSASATPAEITHAYRQQLRVQHPDTRRTPAGADPGADEQLQRLLAGYAILRDPARRAAYDRTVSATPRGRFVITTPDSGKGIDIPITRTARSQSATKPPLWVGPVRQHR